jgi:outer membrane lipoprotein SlyB
MKRIIAQSLCLMLAGVVMSGCARDLSSNMYVSDQTQSFTMSGHIIGVRRVKVKEGDRLQDNQGGMLAGGILGGIGGSAIGGGRGSVLGAAGGALAGAALGAVVQDKLGVSEGYEYIVKLDKASMKDNVYYEGPAPMRAAISTARATGLMTVVQGTDELLNKGQKVYIVISSNRARVIRAD